MKVTEIRAIAKSLGLQVGKRSKPELIRAIQIAEGNFDCFSSAGKNECDRMECCWRDDCVVTA
jgi:hypothetical protein